MNCGKSFICRQLITNLNKVCFFERNPIETEIVMVTKSKESSDEMDEICKKNKFKYSWWKIIHLQSMFTLLKETNEQKHYIMILEDMSADVNKLNSVFNSKMIDFLYRSRHHNISMIYFVHGIVHSMTRKGSFERAFLDNSNALIIFKPISQKKAIYNYLRNFFNKETFQHMDEVFELSSKIQSHPYILIQPNKNFRDELSKIRIDIFNHNLFLKSGI